MMTKDAGLKSAMAAQLNALNSVISKSNEAAGVNLGAAAEQAVAPFNALSGVVVQLTDHLSVITGLNFGNIIKLLSVTGAISAVSNLTHKFMEETDEIIRTKAAMAGVGFEVDKEIEKFEKYANTLAETGNISREQAKNLALQSIQKGVDPRTYQESTAAAVNLAAATGVNVRMAERMVELAEAGNYQIFARQIPAVRQLIQHGASRQAIEEEINRTIERGAVVNEARANSLIGQINRMKVATSSLYEKTSQVFGPPIGKAIGVIVNFIAELAKSVEETLGKFEGFGDKITESLSKLFGFNDTVGLGEKIIKKLNDTLVYFLSHLDDWIKKAAQITGWINDHGGLINGVLIPAITALGAAWVTMKAKAGLSALGNGLRALWPVLQTTKAAILTASGGWDVFKIAAMDAWAVATWGLSLVVPLLLQFLPQIAAAVAGFFQMERGSNGFSEAIVRAIKFAKDGFFALWDVVQRFWAQFMKVATPVINWIGTTALNMFSAFRVYVVESFKNIESVISVVWDLLKEGASIIGETLTNLLVGSGLAESWEDLGKKINGIIKEVLIQLALWPIRLRQIGLELKILYYTYLEPFVGIVIELGKTVWEVFREVLSMIGEQIKNILTTIWDGVSALATLVAKIGGKVIDDQIKELKRALDAVKGAADSLRSDASSKALKEALDRRGKLQLDAEGRRAQLEKEFADNEKRREGSDKNADARAKKSANDIGKLLGHVTIGNRDKAHFEDLTATFKRLQTRAASPDTDIRKMQLTQLEGINKGVQEMAASLDSLVQTKDSGQAAALTQPLIPRV